MVWCGGWWVRAYEEEWWHGGWKGGKDGVKDMVTQKQKDVLFPQTIFPLLSLFFLFFKPFPFLTLSCCATIFTPSLIQHYFHPQHMCMCTMNTSPKPTQHTIHFIVFVSCSNSHLLHLSLTGHLPLFITQHTLCAMHQTTFMYNLYIRT